MIKNKKEYYLMKEMDNIQKDTNQGNNILVDEDENEIEKNINIVNSFQNKINSQDIQLNIRTKENQLEQNNYLSQIFQKNIFINIIIILSLIILIILEYIYKRPLFNYSLTYEQNLQNSISKYGIQFYKLISTLGRGILIGIGLFFVLCYYPLVKTIILCISLIFIVYLNDIMKLLYGDPRPFWINTILIQGRCETSYGNPSGHSMASFFFFLSLCYYICMLEKIKNNCKYKIIVYSIGIFFSGLTAFSRLVLGVHSLDQVLYGSAMGIWVFFIFSYVFKIYDMPLSYYLKFFKDRKYFNFFMKFLTILFIIPIILYQLIDVKSDFEKYQLIMSKKCPKKEKYKFYSHNCMAESLVLLLIYGIYFGQYLFWFMIYKYYNIVQESSNALVFEDSINHWNNYYKELYSSIGNIIKILGLIIIILLPGVLYFIISGVNNAMITIFIFKIGLPLFLIGFLAFGPCFYILIYILMEKNNIYVNYPQDNI